MDHLVCSHHCYFCSNSTQELTTSLQLSQIEDCRNNEVKYVRICESGASLYGSVVCVCV